MSRPRFILKMVIEDGYQEQRPVVRAIGVDEALRISPRMVDDIKLTADLGVALVDAATAIQALKDRKMRRDVLVLLAKQLAGQLADQLEDAEGWHDESRVEPARAELGGDWR